MTCEALIEFLADYLDGALPEETVLVFERHLTLCKSCDAYLETYRETIRMARATATAPTVALREAPEELIQAILATRQTVH
jgi:predicted anti-sigma-YlaC factor YlaD